MKLLLLTSIIFSIPGQALAWSSSVYSSNSKSRVNLIQRTSTTALSEGSVALAEPTLSSSSTRQNQEKAQHTAVLTRSGADEQAWLNIYKNCPTEIDPLCLAFDDLPDDFPSGTYFRNGHARFQAEDGIQTRHMFDGDGMITGLTFYNDENDESTTKRKKVLFRNRFVRTEGYRKDMEIGGMSQPGVFGTRVSGGWWKNILRLDFKNVANTHVLYANKKLYALWEAGWPYVVDALTLKNDAQQEPKGHDLDQLLPTGDPFAAHYTVDPCTGYIVNFGAKLLPASSQFKIQLYELDTKMQSIRNDEMSVVFNGAGLAHDMAVTENWCIFNLPPAQLDNNKALEAMLGKAAFSSVISFVEDAEQSSVILVPRSQHLEPGTAKEMLIGEDTRIKVIQVPWSFTFHFANAFENENGNVILDAALTEHVELGGATGDKPIWIDLDFESLIPNRYTRLTLDPRNSKLVGPPTVLADRRNIEFPIVPLELKTKKHRYAYTVATHQELQEGKGGGVHGALMKIDTVNPENNEVYSFLPHEFVSEPMFVTKNGVDISDPMNEDKGYIISFVMNGQDSTTDLVIFDAEGQRKFSQGPVARLRMPTFIPPGLHGTFVDGLTFDF